MSDPIDWAWLGMPEGVSVEFSTLPDAEFKFRWELPAHSELGLLVSRFDPFTGQLSAVLDGDEIHVAVEDFPILEALMRAARAIEAGEVKLEDSDDE
jgi:hypothetical protein